ncbi:hypothetical protein C0J52_12256 [Blattella germanica]|nr:hypothetical protein C0J52_12256 [Blattella germanica]
MFDWGPIRCPSAPIALTPTPGTREVAAGPGPTCAPTGPECCNCEPNGPGAVGPISREGDPGAETNGPSAPGRLKAELLGGPIPAGAPARLILAKLELMFAIGSTCGTWDPENS